ncbi:MAG: SIS domain-containing protein [Patescibacteria group bacterium]
MLDDKVKILQLDSKNMLGSIQLLGKQVAEVLALAKKVKIPSSYKKASNIVVLGMGGSALGAHLIKSVFLDSLKIPVEIVNKYLAPEFVSKNSLVIASSYSGSTEEIISAVADAKKRKAKIMVIASGGKLADWAKQNHIPALVFSTNNNPCGSPRMGLGYSIFGQIALLDNTGILKLSATEIKTVLQTISKFNYLFGVDNPEEKNLAKQLATSLLGKSVWFAASEHLAGNAHIAANQMNENAKRFSGYFVVPEMNHYLMEGLLFPENNKENIKFLLLESELYDKRVQKRYAITKQILDKNNIGNASYTCQEKNKFLQACEALVLFSYVSFYSAMLQGIDPTAIPVVDFFKEQLKK